MTDISTTPRSGIRTFAAVIVLAVVAGLTLAPPSIAAPARRVFVQAMAALAEPLVLWIPGGLTERVLNTLLFVPLGATVALLLSRRLWPIAIFAGFALSATVEFVQDSIPGRVPDLADVLWNTVGGAIGVLLVTLPRVLAAAVRRAGRRHPTATAAERVSVRE
ncbi:VanZ family protein [Microbacterium sp. CPCC 204701]|uniref:VanZ family protein n=1 Tax=Microbacterium sp. CPCC 204701 TaxID=2493084 RepID=UPI000FD8A9AB|nr:VanZ family protein [Microbacterium sp. CPCC 204701]